VNRAVAWLLGGLVAFVLLLVAIAPELLGDLGFAGGAVAITLAAVIPGLLVVALFASSRRGRRIRRHEHHTDDPGA
jgi:Na+-driven multidrug efflux pump